MARGRKNALWISFAGTKSSDIGVNVVNIPNVPIAESRGSAVNIPGRDGALWLPDETYSEISINIDIVVGADANYNAVMAWLSGSGDLILSPYSGYYYKARVVKAFEVERGIYACGGHAARVVFDCKPFRYQVDEPALPDITQPQLFQGSGTHYSRPVITVYGSGDINLMVNRSSVLMDDVDGSITLDCDAMMAFVGQENASPRVTVLSDDDSWPTLEPTMNEINWSGSVSRIVIQPNWRWR